MKIAFYKASTGTLLDRTIDRCTGRLGYSHVELVFSTGHFFSSSPRDHGVRFKKWGDVIQTDADLNHWGFFDFPLPTEREKAIQDWCATQVGKRYDWMGVLGFITPLRQVPSRWFCSEIVTTAIQSQGIWKHLPASKVSPNGLMLICKSIDEMMGPCRAESIDYRGKVLVVREPKGADHPKTRVMARRLWNLTGSPTVVLPPGKSIETLDDFELLKKGLKRAAPLSVKPPCQDSGDDKPHQSD